MGCRYWHDQILAAVDKKLAPEAEAKLLQHIHVCPKCAESFAWQKSLHETLSAATPVKAPERFNQKVWQKIEATPVPMKFSFRWAPITLGALGMVAAAFAFVVISNHWFQDETAPTSSTPAQVVAQPDGLTPVPGAMETISVEPMLEEPERAQENIVEEKIEQVAVLPTVEPKPKQTSIPEEESQDVLPAPQVAKDEEQEQKKRPEQQVRPRYGYKPPRIFKKRPQDKATEEESKKTAASGSTQDGDRYQVQAIRQMRLLRNKIHINRNEKTRLEFMLTEPGHIQARIFSREGRLMKTIADLQLPVGSHFVEWDGSTEAGGKVASGIYMLVLSGDIEEKRFKIAVIK
jgi:FlgD Ig-like domain